VAGARDSKEWAYIARFRWRGVVKDALLLVLLIGFFVWVIAHDSLAWYGYLGEAAFLYLSSWWSGWSALRCTGRPQWR